jgi:hypothetical protein
VYHGCDKDAIATLNGEAFCANHIPDETELEAEREYSYEYDGSERPERGAPRVPRRKRAATETGELGHDELIDVAGDDKPKATSRNEELNRENGLPPGTGSTFEVLL